VRFVDVCRRHRLRPGQLYKWRRLVDLGVIGIPGTPELDAKAAGSGASGDLLAHRIDPAMRLSGGIAQVTAMLETFIKERRHTLTGKIEAVTIDRRIAQKVISK
jgi:transposase-like protein